MITGTFICMGFNYLPGDTTNEKTTSASVDIVVVKDVTISLTTNYTSDEIYFGTGFIVTCVAEGGRAPYYLQLTHTEPENGTFNELVLYDSGNDTGSVDVGDHNLTFIYTIANSVYENNGQYKCVGKNRATGATLVEEEKSLEVIIG